MKLTPYYLLFSLAFLGLMGQKAYEYKLEQDDKKEVFCKNALFLLQAPDSLSNRVVDFDLPMDSLVKSLKGNVFIDSCNKGKFDFATKINFPKQNKSEEKYTKFPLRFEYYSKCIPFERIGCGPGLFHIVYNNNMENYSRIVYEEYLEILDSLPRL